MEIREACDCQSAREFSEGYAFVSDSQELREIVGGLPVDGAWCVDETWTLDQIGSAFVLVGEAEYLEVWISEMPIPWGDVLYWRIA